MYIVSISLYCIYLDIFTYHFIGLFSKILITLYVGIFLAFFDNFKLFIRLEVWVIKIGQSSNWRIGKNPQSNLCLSKWSAHENLILPKYQLYCTKIVDFSTSWQLVGLSDFLLLSLYVITFRFHWPHKPPCFQLT